mgnify:CR=1 FL=1
MLVQDLGRVVTGKTPSTKNVEYWDGAVPFITPKDIQGTKHISKTERCITSRGLHAVKGSILPPRSICVSCIGNIGYVGMTNTESVSNQQINSIVVNENNDVDFVYYLMKSLWGFFKNYEGQSTALSILNKTQFSQIEVDVPDISVQREIAAALSALDDKIENNAKINHHLEQMARAIFKSWFVDFEPFGGVRPSDWREGTLADIASVTMGQSPDGSSYNESGTGTVFYQGRTDFGSRFPTRRLFTTQPKRMAIEGDILVSVRAPVGDLNVAAEPCCLGRGLAGIQSKSGNQSFILYTMFALKQQLDMFNGEGTVFGSINKNDMATLSVVIPTDEVVQQFESIVKPMDETIRNNFDEICHLQAARDTLLPRLMSGELSVADNAAK